MQVVSITELGEDDVWDIEVEEDHSYIAQGFINHNSSSGPNLQNIPSRDGRLGPMCRAVFIPEEGCDWGRIDWSQIEYRFLVHYAVAARCKDAEKAADLYINNSDTDFHSMAAAIVHPGKAVTKAERERIKSVNFGIAYGMGINGLARDLGVSREEAEPILNEFYTRLPWLKEISSKAMDQATNKGFIRTIMGRRQRFDLWELKGWGQDKSYVTKDIFEKLDKREQDKYRRARVHKALNALLQGSAADLMKLSMVTAYNKGLFKVLVPHITVHDELGLSVPKTKEGKEAFAELVNLMETVMPLNVPVLASSKLGANWSECK